MAGNIKDKLILIIVLIFLLVAGFTFNFYNSLPEFVRNIGVVVSAIFLIIIVITIIKKI